MNAISNEKDILERLVVDEKDVIKHLSDLVDKAKEVFQIERPSGRILLLGTNKLTDQQRILAVLSGKFFASKLGFVSTPELGISEIAGEVGRPTTALSGPIKELAKKGLVEKRAGRRYSVSNNRVREIIEFVTKNR